MGEEEWTAGRKARVFGVIDGCAAVLLLIIAGVVIFMQVRHQQFWDNTVAADSVGVRSQKRADRRRLRW